MCSWHDFHVDLCGCSFRSVWISERGRIGAYADVPTKRQSHKQFLVQRDKIASRLWRHTEVSASHPVWPAIASHLVVGEVGTYYYDGLAGQGCTRMSRHSPWATTDNWHISLPLPHWRCAIISAISDILRWLVTALWAIPSWRRGHSGLTTSDTNLQFPLDFRHALTRPS